MLVAECFAFVWGVNTPMIVVDIDGTITRSDVSGLLMTLTPGLLADRTHLGICKLLARMVDEAVSSLLEALSCGCLSATVRICRLFLLLVVSQRNLL